MNHSRLFDVFVGMAIFCLVFMSPAYAEPTNVNIHVLAKDAKLIGSGMGGVRVTIKDRITDKILDKGIVYGGTGNTTKIVKAILLP